MPASLLSWRRQYSSGLATARRTPATGPIEERERESERARERARERERWRQLAELSPTAPMPPSTSAPGPPTDRQTDRRTDADGDVTTTSLSTIFHSEIPSMMGDTGQQNAPVFVLCLPRWSFVDNPISRQLESFKDPRLARSGVQQFDRHIYLSRDRGQSVMSIGRWRTRRASDFVR